MLTDWRGRATGGGGAFLGPLEEVVAEVVWSRFSLWPFNSRPVSLATPALLGPSDTKYALSAAD